MLTQQLFLRMRNKGVLNKSSKNPPSPPSHEIASKLRSLESLWSLESRVTLESGVWSHSGVTLESGVWSHSGVWSLESLWSLEFTYDIHKYVHGLCTYNIHRYIRGLFTYDIHKHVQGLCTYDIHRYIRGLSIYINRIMMFVCLSVGYTLLIKPNLLGKVPIEKLTQSQQRFSVYARKRNSRIFLPRFSYLTS